MIKKLGVLCCALLPLFASLALLPEQASAATQNVPLNFSGSGTVTDVLSAIAVCDPCVPDVFYSGWGSNNNSGGGGVQGNITAQASWSAPAPVTLNYSQGNLRHGSTLDLSDTLTPGSGNVTINYGVNVEAGLYGTTTGGSCADLSTSCNGWVIDPGNTLPLAAVSASDTFPCALPLPGDSPRTCTNTKTITLLNDSVLGLANLELDLILDESVTVTGSGVSSMRIATISGGPAIPSSPINFGGSSPSTVADPIFISCTQPVGSDLFYSLTGNNYNAEPATYSGDLKFKVHGDVLGIGGTYTSPALASVSGPDLGPIPMSAPDQQVDLGPVQKNTTPPTVDPGSGGLYSGLEGVPVAFDATGSSAVCGLNSLTFVWNFSDGGVAYGPKPTHTFESPGTFTGLVTATDPDGNTASATFTVDVTNQAPVANAGPNMSTEWGVPVTLNGSAVDPGLAEEPFLNYNWQFGDGTPSASGGPSVTHTYASPAASPYTATFMSCDPENACGSSPTLVTVNKRATTLSYTGVTASDVTDPATIKASLIDDQGAPVQGRTVSFFADGSAMAFASAATNAAGTASTTFPFPSGSVGTHTIVAKFSGDGFYNMSQFTVSFNVNKDGTILTYTGPLTSSPSKSLPLSAKLTDDMGRGISGKTIHFSFGAGLQGCDATTNGSGVAACTISKLTQKPGNHTLTTGFDGDADYLASSASTVMTVK